PLLTAASEGGEGVVRMLVEAGADMGAADYHGRTALHRAAYNCDLGTARVLVSAGANPGARDDRGRTPRYAAM
ncbi:ankyrin repeat-containing domain protein, partial [Baffinella frigidus]